MKEHTVVVPWEWSVLFGCAGLRYVYMKDCLLIYQLLGWYTQTDLHFESQCAEPGSRRQYVLRAIKMRDLHSDMNRCCCGQSDEYFFSLARGQSDHPRGVKVADPCQAHVSNSAMAFSSPQRSANESAETSGRQIPFYAAPNCGPKPCFRHFEE